METPNPALSADMKSKGIDIELALSVLRDFNAGKFDGIKQVSVESLPGVDILLRKHILTHNLSAFAHVKFSGS